MSAKKYDRDLGIKTTGLREWDNTSLYNRYEATPYRGMEALFQSYRLGRTGRVVDFGCGRGRVVFYIHRRVSGARVGLEGHEKNHNEGIGKKRREKGKTPPTKDPTPPQKGFTRQEGGKPQDSCFYFFNPFSSRVFEKVLRNIAASLEKHPREIDLILYYPLPEYKQAVRKHSFRKINKIRVPGAQDPYGKFVIYRFTPKAG